jgi:hypothetical protein
VYVYSSPKAFDFAFLSSYHLIRLFVELGRDKSGLLASFHVAKSKTRPYERLVIHFDQDCASVWNIFVFFMNTNVIPLFFKNL